MTRGSVILREIYDDHADPDRINFRSPESADSFLGQKKGYTRNLIEQHRGLVIIKSFNGHAFYVDEYDGHPWSAPADVKHYLATRQIVSSDDSGYYGTYKDRKLTPEELEEKKSLHVHVIKLVQALELKYGSVSRKCVREMPPELVTLHGLWRNMKYSKY